MLFGFDFIRGSGNVQSRNYDLKGFRSVKLAGVGVLNFEQTDQESVRIEADDNLFDYLRVEMRGTELHLGLENRINLHSPYTLRFFVTAKEIEGIALSGSGDVFASAIKGERLHYDISGSGDLDAGPVSVTNEFSLRISGSGEAEFTTIQAGQADVTITGSGKVRADEISAKQINYRITGSGDIRVRNIDTESVETRVSGSGDLEMQGRAAYQRLSISSAGHYKCDHLQSDRADIEISGAGSARVDVKEKLDARISGSGTIHYKGKPIVVMSVSGAGKVKSME